VHEVPEEFAGTSDSSCANGECDDVGDGVDGDLTIIIAPCDGPGVNCEPDDKNIPTLAPVNPPVQTTIELTTELATEPATESTTEPVTATTQQIIDSAETTSRATTIDYTNANSGAFDAAGLSSSSQIDSSSQTNSSDAHAPDESGSANYDMSNGQYIDSSESHMNMGTSDNSDNSRYLDSSTSTLRMKSSLRNSSSLRKKSDQAPFCLAFY